MVPKMTKNDKYLFSGADPLWPKTLCFFDQKRLAGRFPDPRASPPGEAKMAQKPTPPVLKIDDFVEKGYGSQREAFWDCWRASCEPPGASWGLLGASWEALGGLLEASLGFRGSSLQKG